MSSPQSKPATCNWSSCSVNTTRKFTRAEVLKLIHLYKKNPCLWNVKSRDYTRTGLKKKAYEEIAQIFNVSITEIKRKIRSIRNTYLIEKKKVDESRKAGYPGKDVYEPKLAWFEEMEFLDESILMRRKIMTTVTATGKEEQPTKQETYTVLDQKRPKQLKMNEILRKEKGKKKERIKRSVRKSIKQKLINKILKCIKKDEDDRYLTFGKSISLQLKNLPEVDSIQAMQEIQAITTAYTVNYLSKTNSRTNINLTSS